MIKEKESLNFYRCKYIKKYMEKVYLSKEYVT